MFRFAKVDGTPFSLEYLDRQGVICAFDSSGEMIAVCDGGLGKYDTANRFIVYYADSLGQATVENSDRDPFQPCDWTLFVNTDNVSLFSAAIVAAWSACFVCEKLAMRT